MFAKATRDRNRTASYSLSDVTGSWLKYSLLPMQFALLQIDLVSASSY
jgi:hypothetical protein